MAYPVARVGSIVEVGGVQGKVITGAAHHFVDGGGAVPSDGVSPEVAEADSVGMETEQMSNTQVRAYLVNRYGPQTADSMVRATQSTATAPAVPVNPTNAKSNPISCASFTNSTPDSQQISQMFTVGQLSSQIYEAANSHEIPTTTALGHQRSEIICNLSYLAKNSLDHFQTWLSTTGNYTFKVGSGFRNNTNGSDHNIGSAADLHIFSNGQRISRQTLLQIATQFVNSSPIPFTQFLLEFSSSSSPGWMHVANHQTGGNSNPRVAYSMNGGASGYPAGLPTSV